MITVDDYSTETGLRVRITCSTTGTTVQIPAEEWHPWCELIKAGAFDQIALEAKKPFIY